MENEENKKVNKEEVEEEIKKKLILNWIDDWLDHMEEIENLARKEYNASFKQTSHEEKIKCFEKALKIYPNYTNALYAYATSLYTINREKEGIKVCNRLYKLDNSHEMVLLLKGNTLMKLKKYEKAIEVYKIQIKNHPTLSNGFCNIAIAYRYLNQVEKAKIIINKQ